MSNKRVELQARLGVVFRCEEIFAMALRHCSAANAHCFRESYERLEFLGDRIITYVVGEALFRQSPALSEGRMTQAYCKVASRAALGKLGEILELFSCVELEPRLRDTLSDEAKYRIVGDVYEALVGAVHEDQGFESARSLIERTLLTGLPELLRTPDLEDSKSQLQRFVLRTSRKLPEYVLLERKDPKEWCGYVCGVYHEHVLLGKGEGHTRKLAELDAAENALKEVKTWRRFWC